MQADEQDRQVGGVLDEADQRLDDDHAQQHLQRPRHPVGRADGEEEADGQAEEQEHGVGVQLAHVARVQTVAGDVDVAGVRTRAGDDGAE